MCTQGVNTLAACQSPAEQVESWCFNSVQTGREGEKKALTTWTNWFCSASDSWWNLYGLMSMSDETWPWYALQTKTTQVADQTGQFQRQQNQSRHLIDSLNKRTFTSHYHFYALLVWHGTRFFSFWPNSNTHFSNVMTSLWPLYCLASRRARSLASELKFRGARVTFSYSVTTKHTGEAMDITCTSDRDSSFCFPL